MSFQTIRRFFYEIHLWLGIVSGIILFIVCLSGTIYVFREEVQHFAEPEKYYVDATENANSLPIDDLIAKIEKERPGFTVSSITVPEFPNRTVTMSLAQKRSGEERDPRAGNTGERRGDRPRVEGERSGRGGGRGDGEGRRENAGPLRGETGAVATGNGPNAGRRGAPPQGGGGHGGRGRNMIYVNPYTGEVPVKVRTSSIRFSYL